METAETNKNERNINAILNDTIHDLNKKCSSGEDEKIFKTQIFNLLEWDYESINFNEYIKNSKVAIRSLIQNRLYPNHNETLYIMEYGLQVEKNICLLWVTYTISKQEYIETITDMLNKYIGE